MAIAALSNWVFNYFNELESPGLLEIPPWAHKDLKRVLHSRLPQPVSCMLSLLTAACPPGPGAGEYFSYPLQTARSENQVSLG